MNVAHSSFLVKQVKYYLNSSGCILINSLYICVALLYVFCNKKNYCGRMKTLLQVATFFAFETNHINIVFLEILYRANGLFSSFNCDRKRI